MKRQMKKLGLTALLCLLLPIGIHTDKALALDIQIPVTEPAQTTGSDIPLTNSSQEQKELKIGDNGNFQPVYTEEDIRNADAEELYWGNSEDDWPDGSEETDTSWYQPRASFTYENQNDAVVTVDANGHFEVTGIGSSLVTITGTTGYSNEFFFAECTILVYPDMTKVTIKKKNLTGVIVTSKTDNNSYGTPHATLSAEIKSDYVFAPQKSDNFISDGYDDGIWDDDWNSDFDETSVDLLKIRLESSNKKMKFGYKLENNVIYFTTKNAGTTKLTLYMNETPYSFQVTVHKVKLKKSTYFLGIRETTALNVKTDVKRLRWKSSDPKTVYVSKKGWIYGRKEGNVLLTATIGDSKLACLVSCVSPQKKLAAAYARKMSAASQYSQEKRMLKGYYDCSSLVWRSYAKAGKYLAATSYAPTAADLARWCNQNGRRIRGGFSVKNVSKLQLLPGDLLFQGGADNGRYRGIYHVEMFTGYEFYGLDSQGNPIVSTTWGARPNDYYFPGYTDKMDMMARP